MGVILLRIIIGFYAIGLFYFITIGIADKTKKLKGVSAVILFPFLLLSKQGRKTLFEKGKKNG